MRASGRSFLRSMGVGSSFLKRVKREALTTAGEPGSANVLFKSTPFLLLEDAIFEAAPPYPPLAKEEEGAGAAAAAEADVKRVEKEEERRVEEGEKEEVKEMDASRRKAETFMVKGRSGDQQQSKSC
jgi:hypothetical protein